MDWERHRGDIISIRHESTAHIIYIWFLGEKCRTTICVQTLRRRCILLVMSYWWEHVCTLRPVSLVCSWTWIQSVFAVNGRRNALLVLWHSVKIRSERTSLIMEVRHWGCMRLCVASIDLHRLWMAPFKLKKKKKKTICYGSQARFDCKSWCGKFFWDHQGSNLYNEG